MTSKTDGMEFEAIQKSRSATQMSKTVMFGKLLSEQEINRVKDKFDEDTSNALEEAIRKHVSTFSFFTHFYLPIA